MKAFVISIGEELLIGQTVNSNASWMAVRLNQIGIGLAEIRVIPDDELTIVRTMEEASAQAELVLITGGLGPTKDDVTKKALGRFFNTEMILNQEVLDDIRRFLQQRGRELNALNRLQALVPAGAKVLRNPFGTAPGIWIEQQGTIFIAMPGVPYEMKEMTNNHVLPALQSHGRKQHILHRTLLTHGIGESDLATRISSWEESLPENIQLAYLPSTGIVKLRLTAKGAQEEILKDIIEKETANLNALIGDHIWGVDENTPEGVVGAILQKRKATVATAESCTGGYVAHRITSIPGSSDWFKGSVVAYSNQVKEALLKIAHHLLVRHGAVSQQVAETMAANVRNMMQTDYAVGITGIAGPGGGSSEKPIGTTWVAIAGSNKVISQCFRFGDNRERNIIRAGNAALVMLKSFIESN